MPGANCVFYGCSTNRSNTLSIFKLPSPGGSDGPDGEHMVKLKNDARKEWLRIILRTRQMTPDLKK